MRAYAGVAYIQIQLNRFGVTLTAVGFESPFSLCAMGNTSFGNLYQNKNRELIVLEHELFVRRDYYVHIHLLGALVGSVTLQARLNMLRLE